MPTIEENIVIVAPAERVFDRLADPERSPEWTPNLIKVERTSEAPAGPELQTRLLARVAGRQTRGTGRCLAWDPPRRLTLESRFDLGVTSATTFELAEQDGGTRVSAHVEYTLPPKGLGRLLGSLLGESVARSELRKALGLLKQQLESSRF